MSDVDLGKVKRNVATMVSKSAPEADIDRYISESGTTVDAVKNFKVDATPPAADSKLMQLKKNTYLGNMVTGAQESGVDLMKGSRWLGEKLYGENPHDTAEKQAFATTEEKLKGEEGKGIGNWLARQAGDPFNIMLADVGGKPVAKAVGKVGEKAIEVLEPKNEKFIADLISPKSNKAVKEAQVGRTTEKGILKSKVVEKTPQEKAIAAEVAKLPVSKYKSYQANYNIIRDANTAEADRLATLLAKSDKKIPLGKLNAALDSSMESLAKNPYITGDAETSAKRVMDGFKDIVIKNKDLSPAGLLKARKEFDRWVELQKGEKIFDSARDSPISTAVRNIRQTVNNVVAESYPEAKVKESLRRQTLLYDAMDNVGDKAAGEGGNVITRFAQTPAGKGIGVGAGVGAGYGAFNSLLRNLGQ